MARQTTRVIGRKTGSLLEGLLGALYGTSSADENPDFTNPGGHDYTDPTFDANTVQPFKAKSGAFGGLKANELNSQYSFNRLTDIDQAARRLDNQKTLLRFASDLENQEAEKALGLKGEAMFDAYDRLPIASQALGPVGSLPPSYADVARLFAASGGAKGADVGVSGLGPLMREQANLANVAASPLGLETERNKAIKSGLVDLGGGVQFSPSDKKYFQGSQIRRKQTTQYKTVNQLNPETGQLEQVQVPSGHITEEIPMEPRTGTILEITPEDIAEARGAVAGSGVRINPASYNPLDLENLMKGGSGASLNTGIRPTGLPRASEVVDIPETPSYPEREPAATSGKAPRPMQSLLINPDVSVLSRTPTDKKVPLDVSNIFSPEMQKGAKNKFIEDLIKRLQQRAWSLPNWSTLNPYQQ